MKQWLVVVVPVFLCLLWGCPALPFPPPQARAATVEGYVVKAATGEPLEGASVNLRPARGGKADYSAVTRPDGHFLLTQIEPGQYRLWAQADGFLPAEYGQRDFNQPGTSLDLGSDDHLKNIVFRLVPAAAISGRVTNETGEPLVKVQVQALRYASSEGQGRMVPATSVSTNGRGEYRLSGLQPGKYYVSATFRPGQSAVGGESRLSSGRNLLYPQTYYPGTTDPTRAVPVESQYGGETSGIDLTLVAATGVTVRGRVLNTITPRPRRRATLQLYPRNPSSRAFLTTPATVADADGRFEIPNVLSGSYMLTASWEEGEQRYTGRLAVEVANVDVDGLTVVIDTGLRLSGRVRLEGDDQFDLAALTILLTSSGESPVGAPSVRVQSDGRFLIENIQADTYRLTITGPAGDLYLKSVMLGGEDGLNPGLDLTNGTARGTLDVLLGTGAGRVEGHVLDEQNNPLPGGRVALVPAPMLRSRRDLYKTTVTDLYGYFALSGITPGEYQLFAWRGAEVDSVQDPDFLRLYESDGTPITIHEKGQLTMRLKVIPPRRKLP